MILEYEFRVRVPEGSEAWDLISHEIPRDATLSSAWVLITPRRASVSAHYVGRRPDGTEHKRTSLQSITIGTNFGDPRWFLRDLVPEALTELATSYLPT